MKKHIFFILTSFLITSCIYGEYSSFTRNPTLKKKCDIHGVILKKDTVENHFGAWCDIYIDKKKNPFPRIGICMGCVRYPPTKSKIKYCNKCDSIFLIKTDSIDLN